ncbi:MAG: DNA-binding protein [Actinobacteria bacterium]|nr:MAG: DNA-binding protein [Actinomycetota bacterium]
MAGIIEHFKRGYEGDARYSVAGKGVVCSHCGGNEFDAGAALLNTRGMTFLNLDWANRNATLLICTNCSHIEWFLEDPDLA